MRDGDPSLWGMALPVPQRCSLIRRVGKEKKEGADRVRGETEQELEVGGEAEGRGRIPFRQAQEWGRGPPEERGGETAGHQKE